jgi:hypothetical protein
VYPLFNKTYRDRLKYYHQDSDYFYLRIKEIKKTKFSGIVYDIRTEDSSFCAPFLVHNSALPLSDFYLECENKDNEIFWNDWKDRVGLLEFLRCLLHDYWLCGETVSIPVWDDYNFEISHFNQYPPENVDIVQSYVSPSKFFMLKPDPKISEKMTSGSELDQAIVSMMEPKYVEAVKSGKPFLLGSDKDVIYLSRSTTKYRQRGISLLSRCLKNLNLKDRLMMLQICFLDRHSFPLKVFKLGSESRGWIPNKKQFDRLQALLQQAQSDPDFNLLYHFGLNIDYVGTKDKIMNLVPEYEWVDKQIMAALFVNEEIIHGGLPSAVRDTINMRTLMLRYNDVREKIERMLITHVFLPMAKKRGMFRSSAVLPTNGLEVEGSVNGKKVLGSKLDNGQFRVSNSISGNLDLSAYDIPRPIWKKVNLVNNAAEQQLMIALESEGKVPLETVLDMMGLDPKIVKAKLAAQDGTIFDPLYRQIREELGKSVSVRQQVLSGKKTKEWKMAEEELDENTPGLGGKGPGKKPALPSLGGFGDLGKPPAEPKKKPALDMGSGLPSLKPGSAGVSVKPPPIPAPKTEMSPMSPMATPPPATPALPPGAK